MLRSQTWQKIGARIRRQPKKTNKHNAYNGTQSKQCWFEWEQKSNVLIQTKNQTICRHVPWLIGSIVQNANWMGFVWAYFGLSRIHKNCTSGMLYHVELPIYATPQTPLVSLYIYWWTHSFRVNLIITKRHDTIN